MKTLLLNTILLITLLSVVSCRGPGGYQGPAGKEGALGQTGAQGSSGTNGQDGQSCTVSTLLASPEAPNGGALIQCPTTQALILNGSNGLNGADGIPGTVVTPVKFCPGVTTYPSKFVEVGFIISGKLYAVYSEHGGFLTEIPVGTYGSDGINASCNFYVNTNLSITNL